MWLTDNLLLQYQRCNRRAFLDAYGDLSQRDPPSDYLQKLKQDSWNQQQQILADQDYQQPTSEDDDWHAGAEATVALMRQGVERIYQGVLVSEGPQGVTLISRPDLLIKRAGQSNFGDWVYELVEIKLGKRPKLEYQITIAFHAQVLAQVQGRLPTAAWLYLRDRQPYGVNLALILPQMQMLLQDCIQMLLHEQEPEVFIARNRCSLCQWFSYCYRIAQQQEHLSLLPGVTPSRYSHLKTLQLTTVEALAAVNPRALERLPGFGYEVADKIVRQAQATLENRAIAAIKSSSAIHVEIQQSAGNWPGAAHHAVSTAAVELYFDIEAEPERNLAYLHGVLIVNRKTGAETFHSFLAENPAAEAEIWQAFLELVGCYPEAPIFHFCPYEVQTVKRLGQLYKTPSAQIHQLTSRFIDLHAWVTQMVTLPVESYALKPIARWLGFNWSDPTANGAQAIYWYTRWLATGDRSFLDAVLRYNEEDCRATYHVKAWLTDFLAQESLQ